MNGDGHPDVLIAHGGADLFLGEHLGDGAGGFGPLASIPLPTPYKDSIELADLDLDGTPDLLVSSYVANHVMVLRGDGAGGFGSAVAYPMGTRSLGCAAADLNADGLPDIACVNENSGDLTIRYGTGAARSGMS